MKRSLQKACRSLIRIVGRSARINLLTMAHQEMGISNYRDPEMYGEEYFIEKILPTILKSKQPVLVDIGANTGEYSTLLRRAFPDAEIFAIEPQTSAFNELSKISHGLNLKSFNVGMSFEKGTSDIFFREGLEFSALGSLYAKTLESSNIQRKLLSEKINLITLDQFCSEQKINHVDFVKIDTEGNEKNVLLGAKRLLKENHINVIQFEFNEMNVFSRSFLRDFYDILSDFRMFRISRKQLISLGEYDSINEIFKIQNIVAIHR